MRKQLDKSKLRDSAAQQAWTPQTATVISDKGLRTVLDQRGCSRSNNLIQQLINT